ncbi:putative galactosidase [Lachnospiraceae bacterium KM106-2]|nr:putative galactosidase [Lachnospiraceae bacterium KM106-2]
MKRIVGLLLVCILVVTLIPNNVVQAARKSDTNYSDFIRGADISMLADVEEHGGKFYQNGKSQDALQIMSSSGCNYARIRLWVDPYDESGNSYGGGHNDLKTALALAKRAKSKGMKVLLDCHLSDWWADPGTQSKPKAWKNLSYSKLKSQVHDYMKSVMKSFKDAGLTPDMVQIGNEISSGVLWNDGKVGSGIDDFTQLGELLESGIKGVRDVAGSSTKIVLHLDNGGSYSLYDWWFGSLMKVKPNLDFDIIGLTYYPMWHGTLEELQWNLNHITKAFNKDVCIVETAYAWTLSDGDGLGSSFSSADEKTAGYSASVQGQIDFMRDLETVVLSVPNNHGLGVFYWEPEWIPAKGAYWGNETGKKYIGDTGILSNPWDNLTLFDFKGNALDSLSIFSQPKNNLISNPSFEVDNSETTSPSGWNIWLGNGTTTTTAQTKWNGYSGNYNLTFWEKQAYQASAYQTIKGLPDGNYTLSAAIMSSGGQKTCQIYAKNYGGSEKNKAIPTSDTGWNIVKIDNIKVTNGQCEIGLYTIANANNWVNIDHVILRKVD